MLPCSAIRVFRKPAVFKAVERVNKYVKKSYKSQHMTKEEAIRIMSHVLRLIALLYIFVHTLHGLEDSRLSKFCS